MLKTAGWHGTETVKGRGRLLKKGDTGEAWIKSSCSKNFERGGSLYRAFVGELLR